MSRWRIALVVEVDIEGDTEEAAAVGEAIANSSDYRFVLDSVWVDPADAMIWGRDLGEVREPVEER